LALASFFAFTAACCLAACLAHAYTQHNYTSKAPQQL
jgi:hypothetical protein